MYQKCGTVGTRDLNLRPADPEAEVLCTRPPVGLRLSVS